MDTNPSSEDLWRKVLSGDVYARTRRLYRAIPATERCKSCNTPLRGGLAPLLRLIGQRPYSKNPRFCNWCMKGIQRRPGGAEIELSFLFVDVRDSTGLAETMTSAEFSHLMNRFYSVATDQLVRTDAFVDKLVGDEVIGLYLPGYAGPNHAGKAIAAARTLLETLGYGTADGPWLEAGVGIHTGFAYVGTVEGAERTVTDFTALGDNVNIAARLVGQARSGEILISDASYQAAGLATNEELPRRMLQLKGKSEPFGVRALDVQSS